MSNKNKQLPPWPQYPNIPIYLDTPDGRSAPLSYGGSGDIPRAPEIITPGRSPRYIVLDSPLRTPSTLAVPTPIETDPQSPQEPQERRRPPLRYFLDKKAPAQRRSKRQSRRPSPRYLEPEGFPTIHRRDEYFFGHERKSSLGLGISDISSDRTLTPETPVVQKDEPNFAQRLEKRLWRYNTSGNVLKRWLLEIISWIISALCMGAIVGVLIYLKDQKLPKWPYGITLNAYVSVISRVASAALLLPTSEALGQLKWSWFLGASKQMWDFEIFDNASRGPWGAILLLIRTKGRSLAALGAVVMLFSLALDPFFQQVVDFPERWMPDDWISNIPTVIQYEPQPKTVRLSTGIQAIDRDPDIEPIVEKFIYGNGTQPVPFGNGTRAEIPLSCPTSNCTWPIYETLGFCSSCVDVSQMLTFACIRSRIDWIANFTGPPATQVYPNATACGYFLNATSETPILMSGYLIEDVQSAAGNVSAGAALLGRAMPLTTNPDRKTLFGGSINYQHIRNPIQDFLVAGSVDAASVFRNDTPVFQECVLSFCVKSIKSSYHWANYEEEIVATHFNDTEGPFPFEAKRIETPQGNGTVVSYRENITIRAPSTMNGGDEVVYGLSNKTALRTIDLFSDIFPFFITVVNRTAKPRTRVKAQLKDLVFAEMNFNPWIPPNNITLHMERLSVAMTNALRSSESREMLLGKAFNTENYVSVRWAWLILPLGLLLLTLIFLLGTILKASYERERVGVWKTSAIATLLYGLPDDMQQKITSSATASNGTPRSKAKELRVKMLSRGWRVSGNVFSPLTPKIKRNRPPPGWI